MNFGMKLLSSGAMTVKPAARRHQAAGILHSVSTSKRALKAKQYEHPVATPLANSSLSYHGCDHRYQ